MSLIAAVYNSVLGLRERTWVSGMTVKKNEVVKSPADNEDYERITATGAGTTDPADDITNYVARSYVRTAALPTPRIVNSGGSIAGLGVTHSTLASLTLNVRTSFLDITGRGRICALWAGRGYSTGGLRVEILVDGRAIFDQVLTSAAAAQTYTFIGFPGASNPNDGIIYSSSASSNGITFVRSFQVFLTLTNAGGGANAGNGIGVGYILEASTA